MMKLGLTLSLVLCALAINVNADTEGEKLANEAFERIQAAGSESNNKTAVGSAEYPVIYANDEGYSYFGTEQLSFYPIVTDADGSVIGAAAPPYQVQYATIVTLAPNKDTDWHPALRRTINVVLSGEVKIEVSNEVRHFGPGSVFIGDNAGTRGHRTSNAGEVEAIIMVAPTADVNEQQQK